MAICYYEMCKDRQLNEVVLMGSHDAAIATGGSNAKTQTFDIYGQAFNGARFFDLRVAAFKTSTLGGKVELKSYHDATMIPTPSLRLNSRLKVGDVGGKRDGVSTSSTLFGVAGFGLQGMLQQARLFLHNHDTEFLIFKFDKSENWDLIMETCRQELVTPTDNYLYANNGGTIAANLNLKKVRDLQKKLLILFPDSAFHGLPNRDALHREGFLQWKNLYDKKSTTAKPYVRSFSGLQYYGKGGVSHSASGDSGKIAQNTRIQNELKAGQGSYKVKRDGWRGKVGMTEKGTQAFAPENGEAVGLMYWTTTGPSKSGILKRNDKMWQGTDDSGIRGDMVALGLQGADPTIRDMGLGSAGQYLKRFMPNIIMVDFVDHMKGNTIRKMNFNSGAVLAQHLGNMG